MDIRVLNTRDPDFEAEFVRLLDRRTEDEGGVEPIVRAILAAVRERGDAAVLDYTRRFDRRDVSSAAALEVDKRSVDENEARVSKGNRWAPDQRRGIS